MNSYTLGSGPGPAKRPTCHSRGCAPLNDATASGFAWSGFCADSVFQGSLSSEDSFLMAVAPKYQH